MFLLDKDKNRIQQIEKKTFAELGLKEREHLQEWIANQPDALGEELLVIQKEFAGFADTNERLDLLAVDKDGALVIIENKLDDSGRDVTWQALKYASYCSNLTMEDIRSIYQGYLDQYENGAVAEERLSEFFDGTEYDDLDLNERLSQRIMMIAANFRIEVTSTVLWLVEQGLRIQCFTAEPYELEDKLLLSFEQIIPPKGTEDYVVRMAKRGKEQIASKASNARRYELRRQFWLKLLDYAGTRTELFQTINPAKTNYISRGSGVRGVGYNFKITKKFGRAEIYIDRGDKAENKLIFDELYSHKEQIEATFSGELEWERMDDSRFSRIKCEHSANVFDEEQWDDMITKMVADMIEIENIFSSHVTKIGERVNKGKLMPKS